MFPEEVKQEYRDFLMANKERLSQLSDAFGDQERSEFRDFLSSTFDEGATTNLQINSSGVIKDTKEKEPGMVEPIEVDDVEDTNDAERRGDTGVKLGDSIPKKVK